MQSDAIVMWRVVAACTGTSWPAVLVIRETLAVEFKALGLATVARLMLALSHCRILFEAFGHIQINL